MDLRIPRLDARVKIAEQGGTPSREFHMWWASAANAIEDSFNQLAATIAATAAATAAADVATTAATDATVAATGAQAAADIAQVAASTVGTETTLVNSYVTGASLTGNDNGVTAKIIVSSHTRVYGDGSSLAVTGADITGLAFSTFYYVYYNDATRAVAAPTFLATTNAVTAAQKGVTHLVGTITTPADGAANTTGNYIQPPGIGWII